MIDKNCHKKNQECHKLIREWVGLFGLRNETVSTVGDGLRKDQNLFKKQHGVIFGDNENP